MTTPTQATSLVQELLSLGLTPEQIAQRSGNRISARTVYRWKKGESTPKNKNHIDALKRLLVRTKG